MITIDDFAKLELKVGTVISAEEIEGSDKLIKLQVDFGQTTAIISSEVEKSLDTESQDSGQARMTSESEIASENSPRNDNSIEDEAVNEIRQILSGIKQWYKPADLIGKQFVFITNLAPRKMMGFESQGMIMAAEGNERPVPLTVSEKVPNGAKIR